METTNAIIEPFLVAVESYDPHSLEYIDEKTLPDQYRCPICRDILVDPLSTSCGHTFCKLCLEELQNTTGEADFKCPVDRKELRPSEIGPSPYIISNILDELEVKCPFSERGCEYTCSRWGIAKHVESDCEYVYAECGQQDKSTGEKCNEKIQRQWILLKREDKSETLEQHPSCHELVECKEKCGERCPRNCHELHLKYQCSKSSRTCNDCRQIVKASLWESHLKFSCPEATAFCPAQLLGCSFSTKRSDSTGLQHHSTTCQFVIMKKALESYDRRLGDLESQNALLRFQVDRLAGQQPYKDSNDQNTSSNWSDRAMNHILIEGERLRRGHELINRRLDDMDRNQGMFMLQENQRLNEEVASLRANCTTMRNQLHFLLAERKLGLHGYTNQNNTSSSAQAMGPMPSCKTTFGKFEFTHNLSRSLLIPDTKL